MPFECYSSDAIHAGTLLESSSSHADVALVWKESYLPGSGGGKVVFDNFTKLNAAIYERFPYIIRIALDQPASNLSEKSNVAFLLDAELSGRSWIARTNIGVIRI